jgi:hypothetical protein
MGDRTYTDIQFSGRITREVAEGLVEQLTEQGCDANDGPEGDITVEHLKIPGNVFWDDECNYANMEGVEAYCDEHHIFYKKTWSAGSEYGPGIEIFDGGKPRSIGALEGEPVMTFAQIKELGVELYGYMQSWDFDYPPLEIID